MRRLARRVAPPGRGQDPRPRRVDGREVPPELGRVEASPAASSLVWSKRDDGSVALVGVPFYCDGTRGEAPQDAEEWISEAVCVCAVLGVEIGIAVWVLGVARARNAIIVACCLPKLLLKLNRYM